MWYDIIKDAINYFTKSYYFKSWLYDIKNLDFKSCVNDLKSRLANSNISSYLKSLLCDFNFWYPAVNSTAYFKPWKALFQIRNPFLISLKQWFKLMVRFKLIQSNRKACVWQVTRVSRVGKLTKMSTWSDELSRSDASAVSRVVERAVYQALSSFPKPVKSWSCSWKPRRLRYVCCGNDLRGSILKMLPFSFSVLLFSLMLVQVGPSLS